MSNKTRGGAREGSGRKRLDAELTRRVNISIADATADRYRLAGDGNLSEGLRRAVTLLDDETISELRQSAEKQTHPDRSPPGS